MRASQIDLYNQTCFDCSRLITQKYSTSFSIGIKAFDQNFRAPIYGIYGFVRLADEIVDTFHEHDKHKLISEFRQETFKAIEQKISLNPILQAFQAVVNQYQISHDLIVAFLCSMEMDLDKKTHDKESYQAYIYGSAEVIGLMCLKVFCGGDNKQYLHLLPAARSLGSAFQKVNFLRDIKSDLEERGRTYFPEIDLNNFGEADKQRIEADIKKDFDAGFEGIKQLPKGTRLGVYIAYVYYFQLFKKITRIPAATVLQKRIRISDTRKLSLYCKALVQQKLNLI
ncbi:phytoene/squalene synthase family protein [Mucilaginibacter sp. L196]|uniref:phytoene/squalene synthase family protein n=1 Tax=Mucilaginibacter sp. L196 TaxID=1641870 RepID=UPI00131D5EED|nr:phytoene/squalene synthase family protein [Mucilaginibacter sp. L196]